MELNALSSIGGLKHEPLIQYKSQFHSIDKRVRTSLWKEYSSKWLTDIAQREKKSWKGKTNRFALRQSSPQKQSSEATPDGKQQQPTHLAINSHVVDHRCADFVTSTGRVLRTRQSPVKPSSPSTSSTTSKRRRLPKSKTKKNRKKKFNKCDDDEDKEVVMEKEVEDEEEEKKLSSKKKGKEKKKSLSSSAIANAQSNNNDEIERLKAEVKMLNDKLSKSSQPIATLVISNFLEIHI